MKLNNAAKQVQFDLKSSDLLEDLGDLPNNDNSVNFFNSFVFNDQITNKKFYLEKNTFKNDNSKIENCTQLLRSTRKFHLNSLSNKNYKIRNKRQVHLYNKQNQTYMNENILKKYLVRRNNARATYYKQKQELRNLLNRNNSFLNASANESSRTSPEDARIYDHQEFRDGGQYKQENLDNGPVDQNNQEFHGAHCEEVLKQLTNGLENSEQVATKFEQFLIKKKEKERKSMKKRRDIISDSLDYNSLSGNQKELVRKLDQDLHRVVIKNSEYLIIPDLTKIKRTNKQMSGSTRKKSIDIKNIFRNEKSARLQQKRAPSPKECMSSGYRSVNKIASTIQDCNFDNAQLKKLVQHYNEKMCRYSDTKNLKNPAQSIPLIQALKNGKYFQIQQQISRKPSLLLIRQQKTMNNLLHLCIIHSQINIFKLLVMKCQENKINLLKQPNKIGKTPLYTAKMYPMFFQFCQSLPEFFQYFQKSQ